MNHRQRIDLRKETHLMLRKNYRRKEKYDPRKWLKRFGQHIGKEIYVGTTLKRMNHQQRIGTKKRKKPNFP